MNESQTAQIFSPVKRTYKYNYVRYKLNKFSFGKTLRRYQPEFNLLKQLHN